MATLSVSNLSCGYGTRTVVQNVSFSLVPGEILCLLGPNGCGKTTLLRAIAGILPYEGTVLLDGADAHTLSRPEFARKVALLSQITSLYFSYTVYETVMMGRYPHIPSGIFHSPSQEDRQIVLSCIREVGLEEEKDKPITALSGGQVQRTMLARIFAQSPQILLLDEPTNHLDIRHQAELADTLRRWAATEERSILGVFHDISLGMTIADRVLLMHEGVFAAQGLPKEVIAADALKQVYGMDVSAYLRANFALWQN